MFAEQVKWAGLQDAAGQRPEFRSLANGDDGEAAFALVYEAILGLSDEDKSNNGESSNWLSPNAENSLTSLSGYSEPADAMNAGFSAGGNYPASMECNNELNPAYYETQYSGSGMARLMSQGGGSQIRPFPSQSAEVQAITAYSTSRPVGNPGQLARPDDLSMQPSGSGGVVDKNKLSDWMDAHALSHSIHHCAMYCRLGMEAAGLNTGDRPESGDAGDYGPFLLRHGAQRVPQDSYVPQVGDVVVFDKTDQHPNGHIEMYDGQQWVSDFKQHSFSPYRDATSTPPFTIYRLA
jgi:hypothetical protein